MEERICRICRGGEWADSDGTPSECSSKQQSHDPLISPCDCKGSCALVHAHCILAWLSAQASLSSCCEVCHTPYRLQWRCKPLSKWKTPSFGREECVRLRLSIISCLLTIADMFFCASAFVAKPACFWASRSIHSFMLLTLSLSWLYCFGVNIIFWVQLFQRWRRQNLELSL